MMATPMIARATRAPRRQPSKPRAASQMGHRPLDPDVDALLWILAREAARIALEDQEALITQRKQRRAGRGRAYAAQTC
jgi:hypothetical protein